ncbi:hypothetical protein [Bacillus sp. UNC438CL73TsuS30]|uniref:hypothetical protein n=1 Tax=Bacillus sp. UNC438CL73TsuS30 TaxID=1340434 RepID=UPI00047A71B8|nr:hypothetical protein [Bacillus sp. UNC438CL73TsuS30]
MDHVEVPEVREVKEATALAVVREVAVPAAVPAAGAVADQVDEKAQAEKKAVQMETKVLKVTAASIPV